MRTKGVPTLALLCCTHVLAQSTELSQPVQPDEPQAENAKKDAWSVETWSVWGDWQEEELPKASWTVRFEPSIWYASPGGNLRLPGAPADSERVRLADLNLDSPRLSAFPEIHYRTGLWRFGFCGYDVRLERETTMTESGFLGPVPFNIGDRVNSEFALTSLELEAGYLLLDSRHTNDEMLDRVFASALEFVAEGVFGVRGYHTSIDIVNGFDSTDQSQAFAHPYIGLRTELDLLEGFSMDMRVTAGWFGVEEHSSFSWDALVGFRYEPTPNFGVQVGYRQNAYGLYDGEGVSDFSLRGATAGFYAGCVIRY